MSISLNLLVSVVDKPCYLSLTVSLIAILLIYLLWISDIVGVVQSVSPTMSIRRKSDNESIPKRDITIADET